MIDLDSACKICWHCGLVQGKTAQLNRGMADRANGLEIAMQDGRILGSTWAYRPLSRAIAGDATSTSSAMRNSFICASLHELEGGRGDKPSRREHDLHYCLPRNSRIESACDYVTTMSAAGCIWRLVL